MTLKTLFAPGPNDSLLQRLVESLGPDADLTLMDHWAPPGNADQLVARSEALVLGPGAEAATELVAEDSDIRFVQFTGCRQPAAVVTALQSSGVLVANAGPALAPFVADHTISLMRAAMSLAGRSEQKLGDLVVGVVGFGNVGIEVARRLQAEGATILYHDIRTAAQGYANEVGTRRQSLDRLLLESDIVTLHVSDTPHTPGLIEGREFRLMKPGVILVNTSSVYAVDGDAATSALESGKLGAFALGVSEPEPEGRFNQIAQHERVITNLRDAIETEGALGAVAHLVAENLRRVEAGETPRGLMDPVGFPGVGDPAFWSSRLAPRQQA